MRSKIRRASHVMALAMAAVLTTAIAAACGTTSAGGGGGGSGLTKPELTFGTISADSGAVILSSISDGTEAWAHYVNTHGGIDGHPVTIKRCDDQLNPTKNQDCARQMIQDSSVLAVIGGESVMTPIVAAPLFNKSGLTYMSTETTAVGGMKGPAMFAITGGAITQFLALAKYFPTHGSKKVALVNATSTSSHQAAKRTTKAVEATGGKVVATVFAKPGTPDYSPVATQLVSSGADVIFCGVTPTDLPALIRAIRQQSKTVKIATLASQWPDTTVKAVGSRKDGIYMATDWAPLAINEANIKALKASLKEIDKSSSFGQGALSGWLGGKAMQALIEGMGATEITRESIAAQLDKATLSVKGIPVKLTLPDKPAPEGLDGLANPSAYVNQWKGDDLKQVALVKDVFASKG